MIAETRRHHERLSVDGRDWTVFEPWYSRSEELVAEAWPTYAAGRARWLGDRESNPDMLVQSQLSYH